MKITKTILLLLLSTENIPLLKKQRALCGMKFLKTGKKFQKKSM